MSGEFQVSGRNTDAQFTLKLHRGDGMTLAAMNWKNGKPPQDFVGFAIEYKEPNGDRFFALKNRLGFRHCQRKCQPKCAVDQALADPEVSLGAFSPQCRTLRRICLPGDAGLYERRRRAELWRGAGGRNRTPARDLSRNSSTSPSPAASCRRRRSWIDTNPRAPFRR